MDASDSFHRSDTPNKKEKNIGQHRLKRESENARGIMLHRNQHVIISSRFYRGLNPFG